MQIHFLRHATFVLTFKGASLLIDPMLSAAETMDPVQNAGNQKRIPMVELPLTDTELNDLLSRLSCVMLTHTHRDHWDARAIELLPQSIPIICPPEDESRIREAGFTAVTPINTKLVWRDIVFRRTGGQHGTGEIGRKMGPVSGFVLSAPDEPTIYITGDTIWCPEVADALQRFTPDVVVVYTGAAAFLKGGPITMTAEDVERVCRACPSARVIAIHMEALNHCGLKREGLSRHLVEQDLAERVSIPQDGARLTF